MKKTILTTALLATLSLFAITPEEMLNNKDYNGVYEYCRTNKTTLLETYITDANKLEWVTYAFTNDYGKCNLVITKAINKFLTDIDFITNVCKIHMNAKPEYVGYSAYYKITDNTVRLAAIDKFYAKGNSAGFIGVLNDNDINVDAAKIKAMLSDADSIKYARSAQALRRMLKRDYSMLSNYDIAQYIDKNTAIFAETRNHFKLSWITTGGLAKNNCNVVWLEALKKAVADSDELDKTYAYAKHLDKEGFTTGSVDAVYAKAKANKSWKMWLKIACDKNDIDGIIDALLLADNSISAEEANSIIAPINAVSADYRKAEILTVLKNINSWCTIKLYDDQATWEPILAKIRAMIELRK